MNGSLRDYRQGWFWAVPVVAALMMLSLWLGGANRVVFLAINGAGAELGATFWSNVTVLGDSVVLFTLALLFVGRNPRLVWALFLAGLVGAFVVHGFKEWLNLERPPAVFALDQINIIGTPHRAVSFPSGHTTAVFTLVGLLCLRRELAGWAKALLLACAVLVGSSRIAVGVHWPMDVLGGAFIGWLSAGAGLWLSHQVDWGLHPRPQRLLAVLLFATALGLLFLHDSGYPAARGLEVMVAIGALVVAVPGMREVFRLVAEETRVTVTQAPPEPEAPLRGRVISALVRLGVTALIFVLIFRSVDLGSLMETLREVVPRLVGLALIFQLISTGLASYRWYLVMRPLGFGMYFPFYLRSYFKGSFFNQGLPTSIGGDAVRVLDVARQGYRKRDSFTGVFIDRVLGLVGLLILNLVANTLDPDLLPAGVFLTINFIVAGGLLGFVALLALRHMEFLLRWRMLRPFHIVSSRLASVLAQPRDALIQLVLSVAVHVLSLIAIFLLGWSVGMEFSLGTFMIIVPPVILLTLIPVSLAGWGVREGAMIGLFTLIGADKAQVLAMSVLYGLILIISSLPGFYVYLTGRHRI